MTPEEKLAIARKALEKIVEIGTRECTERTGDMYDPVNGYTDYTTVSDEAEIAQEALDAMDDA